MHKRFSMTCVINNRKFTELYSCSECDAAFFLLKNSITSRIIPAKSIIQAIIKNFIVKANQAE